jgi:hypothetical protein
MKLVKLEDLKYLDEVDILYPKPKKIKIADDYVIIKELPLDTLDKLTHVFKKLKRKYPVINDVVVPESVEELNEETDKFENMILVTSILCKAKSFRKIFVKMLKMVMPEMDTKGFIPSKYILKHITETEVLQVVVAIFVYNFASDLKCKKKVKEIAAKLVQE